MSFFLVPCLSATIVYSAIMEGFASIYIYDIHPSKTERQKEYIAGEDTGFWISLLRHIGGYPSYNLGGHSLF